MLDENRMLIEAFHKSNKDECQKFLSLESLGKNEIEDILKVTLDARQYLIIKEEGFLGACLILDEIAFCYACIIYIQPPEILLQSLMKNNSFIELLNEKELSILNKLISNPNLTLSLEY